MFVSNNNFMLPCAEPAKVGARSATMFGYIFIFSLTLTAVFGESPATDDCKQSTPWPPICPKNEERSCRNPCPPETCLTLYAAFDCIQNQTCVNGCHCKKGYLRIGQKGPCVAKDQCNPLECVDDPNARKGCGDKCGKTCADYKIRPICPKRPCRLDGCECKEGYVYDQNLSLCVKPKDCTASCTKPHERYIDCLAGQCNPKTCEDLGGSISCPFIPGPCPGGCMCEEGYVYNSAGSCIKLEDCPPKPCRKNETWVTPCNSPCQNPFCPRDDKPPRPCVDILPCYPGCRCKPNYLRNATGQCILASDCPPVHCTRPNEEYKTCPVNRINSCALLGTKPVANTGPRICNPGCICKEGFYKNNHGTCVPKWECRADATSSD